MENVEGGILLNWAPVEGAAGYVIYRRAWKVDNWKTGSTVIKNLAVDTTYFVRIRSYHVFNGMTYYGGWSNVLSGTVQ